MVQPRLFAVEPLSVETIGSYSKREKGYDFCVGTAKIPIVLDE